MCLFFNIYIQSGSYASDLGGILGLWLGCSILTVCELFEFIMDIMVLTCKKYLHRRRGNSGDKSDKQDGGANGDDRASSNNKRRTPIGRVTPRQIDVEPWDGNGGGMFNASPPPPYSSRQASSSSFGSVPKSAFTDVEKSRFSSF